MKKREVKKFADIEKELNEIKIILIDALDSKLEYHEVYNKFLDARKKVLDLQEKVEDVDPAYASEELIVRIEDALGKFILEYNGVNSGEHYAKRLLDAHNFDSEKNSNLYCKDRNSGILHSVEDAISELDNIVTVKENFKLRHNGYLNNKKKGSLLKRVANVAVAAILLGSIALGVNKTVENNKLKQSIAVKDDKIAQYEGIINQHVTLTEESRTALRDFLKGTYPVDAEKIGKYNDAELVAKYIQATQEALESLNKDLNGKNLTIKEKEALIDDLKKQIEEANNNVFKLDDASRKVIIADLMYNGVFINDIKDLSDADLVKMYFEYIELANNEVPGGDEIGEGNDKEPEESKTDDVYVTPGGIHDMGESDDKEPVEEENGDILDEENELGE